MLPHLVLSSPLGTTRRMWDPNVEGLSRRYDVIRYEHPGHGDAPLGPRTIEGLARVACTAWRDLLVSTPREGYARACEAIADMDLRDDLGRIEAPTTVIVGSEDPVIDEESKRLLAQVGEVVELDAAHLANVERPDEFNEAVLSA